MCVYVLSLLIVVFTICTVYVCLCRVSRSQMVSVLWHRSNHVDKQEMDALLDVAVSAEPKSKPSPKTATTRSSRKRPREEDKVEGQGV